MIQRKQSLFLLASVIIMLFMMFRPISYTEIGKNNETIKLTYAKTIVVTENAETAVDANKVQFILWAMIGLAIVTILLFKNRKLVGSNYSAFLRKNLNDKKSIFSFSKTLSKLKKRKYFFKHKFYNSEILIYKYDNFYNDLNLLYKQNNKIFLKYR